MYVHIVARKKMQLDAILCSTPCLVLFIGMLLILGIVEYNLTHHSQIS